MPASVSLLGDALIALGFLFIFFVFRENSYGASTIQIAEGQTVVSTGPYVLVLHPMYAGGLVMWVGIPLALGSWWGLFVLLLLLPVLIWRLLDPAYLAAARPAFEKFGARFLVRGGRYDTMEGSSRERNVVVEFADYATALACYRSAEYSAARQLRNASADADFIVAEGVTP